MAKLILFIMVSFSTVAKAAEPVEQDSAEIARLVMQQEAERQRQAVQERNQGSGGVPSMGGNSINPSALMGQGSQKKGKDSNDSAGQALMAAGAALMSNPYTMPAGMILMAMGQLAKKQGDHDNNAAGQSGATFAASGIGGATGSNPTTPNPSDPTGKSGYQDPKIAAALKKFNEAGYKVTEDGLIHPDGKLTPASAFNSPASMAAAGLDPRGIKEAQKVLDVVNQELAKNNKMGPMSVATDGGGGAGSANDSESNSNSESAKFDPFGLGANQKKALIAGKTVLFDGEPIGVAGNNIFEMVHSAYQKRRLGNQFIETEIASGGAPRKGLTPASMRGPASTPNNR